MGLGETQLKKIKRLFEGQLVRIKKFENKIPIVYVVAGEG
jgi:hypothetical protein